MKVSMVNKTRNSFLSMGQRTALCNFFSGPVKVGLPARRIERLGMIIIPLSIFFYVVNYTVLSNLKPASDKDIIMRKFEFSVLLPAFLLYASTAYPLLNEDMEAIPTNHSVGKKIITQSTSEYKYDYSYEDMEKLFEEIDERGNSTDLRFSLLRMKFKSGEYKGSGTILYCDDNNILVLTALHNIENGAEVVSELAVYADGKDMDANIKLADVVQSKNDYVKVPKKDVAFFVAKKNSKLKNKEYVPMHKPLFTIVNLQGLNPQGVPHKVAATIHQYPSQSSHYFKTSGLVYYDSEESKETFGYSDIPTLAGASGSSVIYYRDSANCWLCGVWCSKAIQEAIIGVHVKAGQMDSAHANITHGSRSIMVQKNVFELISSKEVSELRPKNEALAKMLRLFLGGRDDDTKEL